jgi:tRNA(Ile)-lysidine synthase
LSARPALNAGHRVAVAFSGGRDSLALLHATVRAALPLGLEVVALHVHHGLVDGADAWLESARRLCARWRRRGWPLRLRSHRLMDRPPAGESVEAWARRERYATLTRLAAEEGATIVLLAQHRRDQAETVLLQALRGGGPKALAAMPRLALRAGLTWARPWLAQPRSAIDAYINRYRLQPIEDPSNADPRWARNRLRLEVWPALIAAFGDAEQTLAAAAARAAEAADALAELTAADLVAVGDGQALLREAWQQLSPARRALVLRAWLAQLVPGGVPETLVQRLVTQWPVAPNGRWPLNASLQVIAYRGRLRVIRVTPAAAHPASSAGVDLSVPGQHPLAGWAGRFVVRAVATGGLPATLLARVDVRAREGGERFQRAPGTPTRSLKKQYQLAGVPAAERDGPLVWCGDRLLYVPGLGVDARAAATPGRPRLTLVWVLHRSS